MKLSKNIFGVLILSATLSSLTGCPAETEIHLEEARAALDICNPTDSNTSTSCQTAIDAAKLVLDADSTNVEAAILSASGHLGLAHVDFLQFVGKLTDVESNSTGATTDLTQFQSLISTVETVNSKDGRTGTISLDELKTAIDVLNTSLTGKTNDTDLNKRGMFQLGAMQGLDTFIRPIKRTKVNATTKVVDPSDITSDDADFVKKNGQNSDNNLSSSGLSDSNTLKATREAFCRCTNLPLSLPYNEKCLRDLIRCELSTVGTEDTEQDYSGNAVVTGDRTADCAALKAVKDTAGYTTCKSSGS